MSTIDDNKIVIDMQKNVTMCLNHGYELLRCAKAEIDYRNSIVLIHNGVELLMKFYLKTKNNGRSPSGLRRT